MDVGASGSASDATIFNDCELISGIIDGTIALPPPEPLPGDDTPTDYFFIGDDAFPLKTWLMKPYTRATIDDDEQRIFNYRLCRARRLVENAFGILANRFQFLLGTCSQPPGTVTKMVLAACCLHNLMRIRYPQVQNQLLDREDALFNVVPGEWRRANRELDGLVQTWKTGREALRPKALRDYLKKYYSNPIGSVPWQDRMI